MDVIIFLIASEKCGKRKIPENIVSQWFQGYQQIAEGRFELSTPRV
jgi:hypothetical protein